MRCPACGAENDEGTAKCGPCGARLTKPARRRKQHFDDKYSLIATRTPKHRTTVLAYRYAMWGLIPVVGLPLGGLALGLGMRAMGHLRREPEAHGKGHAMAAIVLGSLEMLTNGVGLALVWYGLTSVS